MKRVFHYKQEGALLIEAVIALLIFSLGILSLLGLQANAIKQVGEAKLRMDASYLASQIVGQMWADRQNLADYSHLESGNSCTFTGTAASSSVVTSWLTEVSKLPNASAQIKVQNNAGERLITVTVCWRAPQETSTHNFTNTALISG